MIYELRTTIFCDSQANFDDVLDKLNDLKPQMRVINPGQTNQECSLLDVIENHHGEIPPAPCRELSHWDNCPSPP